MEKIKGKGVVKRRFLTKIIVGVALIGIAVGSALVLTGCFLIVRPVTPVTPTPPPIENTDSDADSDADKPSASISFADFLESHLRLAIDFVEDYVTHSVVQGRDLRIQSIAISANENDELTSVDMFCTYNLKGTTRAIEYSHVELENPLDLDKIVADTVRSSDVDLDVDSQTIIKFDAKAVASDKKDIANELYKTANLSGYSSAKIYSEVGSEERGVRAFNIVEQNGKNVIVRNISVFNDSDETLISDLNDKFCVTVKGEIKQTYVLKGTPIQSQSIYVLEDFASTVDPTDPSEQIKNISDLVTNYSVLLATALEDNFMSAIRTKYLYNAEDILSTQWDIGTSDTISEIKLIAAYNRKAGNQGLSVISIKLETPIKATDINKDNIASIWASNVENSTYQSDYLCTYDASIQGTRNDLVNAIFEAKGMPIKADAARLFEEVGSRVDDELKTRIREFKLVEVTNEGIEEFSIILKEAATDEGLIENLKDPSNYRFHTEKSASFNGNKVSVTGQASET